jgi:hypothetical protein
MILSIEQRLQIYTQASTRWILAILICTLLSILGEIWSILFLGITFFYFQKQLNSVIPKTYPKLYWLVSTLILSLLWLKLSVENQIKTSCLQNSSENLFGYGLFVIWTSIFVWEACFYAFVYKSPHFVKNINVRK